MSKNSPKRPLQGLPRRNTLVQWRSALSMTYHTNTADRKYQLLFFVSCVKIAFNGIYTVIPFHIC